MADWKCLVRAWNGWKSYVRDKRLGTGSKTTPAGRQNLRIGEAYFHVKACSHGTIMNAIPLSQLLGCMAFNVSGCDCDNGTKPNRAH